jgi:anthranilate phosphoribosyltransferase
LSQTEAADLVGAIMDGAITPNQASGILVALAARGEDHDELAGAARAMRDRCIALEHELPTLVDIVGTGGDGKGSINISTMAAIVVAAAGIPVAKHGNRAASSACGSADVLEAAGMPVALEPETCARMLREANFTFLFAPAFHPAMRAVANVRRDLGVPTIFNLLGPLTNPARPTHQIVGVATPEAMSAVARIFESTGTRGVVLRGSSGYDEVEGAAVTECIEFTGGAPIARSIDPASFGIRTPGEELAGPTLEACVEAFWSILSGERSGRADVVALNAAVAIDSAKGASSLAGALALAREVLASGKALQAFERAREIARA